MIIKRQYKKHSNMTNVTCCNVMTHFVYVGSLINNQDDSSVKKSTGVLSWLGQ